jgi:phage tail sheath protein FI
MFICSPRKTSIVDVSSESTQVANIKADFSNVTSSSYAVLDSGWVYSYDRFNDKYCWVPGNGHTAGIMARSDLLRDPWFSPAGFSRGQYLGITKLAFNPKQASRDDLYRARINPIVTFPGQGTVLFGDKTALTTPSAFDRINVRRLFIVLEKAISAAAQAQLFEFNDAFTRAQFRSAVEPFLRDVKNRRGLVDFSVICDETNNTDTVIDRNEFVCSIFVKPARSINFITLNFVAARSGVEFSEIYSAV